ncbi:hypothetical protein Sjap_010152 [Stephania japonica]|uniref:DUF4283 domain-containing protein n=1 Tax=Stephania japonica TaxID=461633 RepID=A0AAP0J9V1_9MAGN
MEQLRREGVDDGGDGQWTQVVRGGRLRPAVQPQETPQHPQEPPISFHIERKFFRVVRRIEGISVSETTPSSTFKVEFTAEETRWLATKMSSRILSDRDLAYQSIRPLREWDFSLIIYRSSLAHCWADISATINIVTHGKEPLQPFGDDRAFLRCTDFRHRETVFGLINQMASPLVEKVTQWRHEHHWKNPKIGIHNGWISIEGLPLNLWNDVAFKMIGEKFGGLIELAEVTKAKSNIHMAFMKVKGCERGVPGDVARSGSFPLIGDSESFNHKPPTAPVPTSPVRRLGKQPALTGQTVNRVSEAEQLAGMQMGCGDHASTSNVLQLNSRAPYTSTQECVMHLEAQRPNCNNGQLVQPTLEDFLKSKKMAQMKRKEKPKGPLFQPTLFQFIKTRGPKLMASSSHHNPPPTPNPSALKHLESDTQLTGSPQAFPQLLTRAATGTSASILSNEALKDNRGCLSDGVIHGRQVGVRLLRRSPVSPVIRAEDNSDDGDNFDDVDTNLMPTQIIEDCLL